MEQYFHFCNQSIALILSDPGPIIVLPCLLLAHSLFMNCQTKLGQLTTAWIWFGWSVSCAAICNRFQKLSFLAWFGDIVCWWKSWSLNKSWIVKKTQNGPFLHYKTYNTHPFGKHMTPRRTIPVTRVSSNGRRVNLIIKPAATNPTLPTSLWLRQPGPRGGGSTDKNIAKRRNRLLHCSALTQWTI